MIREFSAGGVVFKKQDEKILWMVVQHSGYLGWIFPKGHIEKGEKSEETAVREVKEETGIDAKIIEKAGEFSYFYTKEGEKVFKNAKFFLMKYLGGNEKDHDSETSAIEWLSYEEALERLSFKDEKKILEKAREFAIIRKS
jgi:8-oxo-dGTP diphosphatase